MQKYPMAWVLFGTYYYNKFRYFTSSQKNCIAVKVRDTVICSTFQQDTKCKRLDSTIKRVTENCCYGNSDHVLVLPYMKAEYKNNKQNYNDYYDEIEVCSESSSAHYKSDIFIRNMNMVDRSNMIVCYIRHNSGGAYKTVQYAKKKGVEICNIADFNFTVR